MDSRTTAFTLKKGLGMKHIARSLHETGNHQYSSFVLQSHSIKWAVLAPYLSDFRHPDQKFPHPNFDGAYVRDWVGRHGSGVGAIGIRVASAKDAYEKSTGVGEPDQEKYAKGRTPPTELKDKYGSIIFAEIYIYGETLLRFIEYKDYTGPYIPGYEPVTDPTPLDYGIHRMDHVVGNVPELGPVLQNFEKWLGFHIFAEFSEEDIQTEWTSLNSKVMANNIDTVLLPLNEPAKKKKESQITEFLKAYNGPGVQHIAMFTPEILSTIEQISKASTEGGFELIGTPLEYYDDSAVKEIMAEHLTPQAIELVKKYGILVDQDEEGVLLQIFTKPLFDRPTIFVEIIQRLCHGEVVDKPGCGGFGKGNFRALFQSIERLQQARGMLLDTVYV
jgi:4-hydroxyphenylpyruvate dioxygenase